MFKHVREPAVAGQFYPQDAAKLGTMVDCLMPKTKERHAYKAIMVPHAGYEYSGEVAGKVYAQTVIPETCVLAGPNHTGKGAAFSIYPKGAWKTPLGRTAIDEELSNALRQTFSKFEDDVLAHEDEHCLEVQLPFLQRIRPDVRIVSIVVGSGHPETLIRAGQAIGKVVKDCHKNVLLIASTDMTHYEPQDTAEKKDGLALKCILKLDPETLSSTVTSKRITMCGWAPTVMLMEASRTLGSLNATLVQYRTSGDTTGDRDSVVGYAGVVFK